MTQLNDPRSDADALRLPLQVDNPPVFYIKNHPERSSLRLSVLSARDGSSDGKYQAVVSSKISQIRMIWPAAWPEKVNLREFRLWRIKVDLPLKLDQVQWIAVLAGPNEKQVRLIKTLKMTHSAGDVKFEASGVVRADLFSANDSLFIGFQLLNIHESFTFSSPKVSLKRDGLSAPSAIVAPRPEVEAIPPEPFDTELEQAETGDILAFARTQPSEAMSLSVSGREIRRVHPEDFLLVNGRYEARVSLKEMIDAIGQHGLDSRAGLTIAAVKRASVVLRHLSITIPALRVRGKIEVAANGRLAGWAVSEDAPHHLKLDVVVDSTRVRTVTASKRRGDLIRAGLCTSGGGFDELFSDCPVWPAGDAHDIQLVWWLTGQVVAEVKSSKIFAELQRQVPSRFDRAVSTLAIKRPRVSIIIPIYNAAGEVGRCLASVLAWSTPALCRVICINDKSTDPRIERLLEQFGKFEHFEIVHNATNMGFTRSCNAGIALAGSDDIILLNSDTEVNRSWLQKLQLAAYADRNIGTVTPLSDNAGPFSIPFEELDDGTGDWSHAERVVRRSSAALWPRVPTGHGFCLYIRADCLADVGPLDAEAFPIGYGEENDFCMRALRRGWVHVIDDRSFVHHVRSASFGAAKENNLRAGRAHIDATYPEYTDLVRRGFGSAEIQEMHSRAQSAFRFFQRSGLKPKPRLLFVISKETGGTPQTNMDLMGSLQDEYETLLLKSDNVKLVLEIVTTEGRTVLAEHSFTQPVSMATHRSTEYDDVLAGWLVAHSVDLVHIRHFCWHSIGLFDVANVLNIPVVLSFHDFYFVCPSIKLLDQDMKYCGGTCTPGAGACRIELWKNEGSVPLKHKWVYLWRAMLASQISKASAFVTTSAMAKDLLCTHFDWLRSADFRVIPHGRDFDGFVRAAPERDKQTLRIVVPGNIGVAKGGKIIRELLDLDKEGLLEVHVMGNTDSSLSGSRAIMHGPYQREDAPKMIAALQPDLGMILSIWPETYCHTLTELWAAGVPVLGFDIGAVGERIRDHGAGWLLPITSAETVYKELLRIREDKADHSRAVKAVTKWQASYGKEYGTARMALGYKAIYAKLLGSELQRNAAAATTLAPAEPRMKPIHV